MEKYDAYQKDLTTRGNMVQAVFKEIQEGRGPVFLDATRVPVGRGGHMLSKLRHLGLDPGNEMIPLVPAVHSFLGGLSINEKCATSTPGLYSCGENGGHGAIYGADRVSGALTACHVLGYRAGKSAALFALNKGHVETDKKEIQQERKRVQKFGQYPRGKSPKDLKAEIKDIADNHLNVCRDRRGLEKAVQEMMNLQEEAGTKVRGNSPYEKVEAMEAENLALTGEMIGRSALLREESRGQHCRNDFPEMDNTRWLKWIHLRKVPGGMELFEEPVPIQKYPFQPNNP